MVLLLQHELRNVANSNGDKVEAVMKALFLSMLMFSVGVIVSFLYVYIYNAKLSLYLKKEKYDRWRELTMIGSFGPGLANPFKGTDYVYSDIDNDDKTILKCKDSIKAGLRYCFFILIALLVNATILAVLIVMSKR